MSKSPRIAMLCGGVGGARAALALTENLPSDSLTFLVNTGDDFTHLGLEIWPDWDTIIYTLSGTADTARGWGRSDEGTRAMEEFRRLDAPSWFHLGDRDLALHVARTHALREGGSASEVAAHIAQRLGVKAAVVRITEESLATELTMTDGSSMDFQAWFVGEQGKPPVAGVNLQAAALAHATPGVQEAISACDLLVVAPSNPYLSIFPMLEVPEIAQAVLARTGPIWAVSPLVGGKAVKGPLDALLAQLSPTQGQQAIVDLYAPWVERLLLPAEEIGELESDDLTLHPCRTWLADEASRKTFVDDLLGLWKASR